MSDFQNAKDLYFEKRRMEKVKEDPNDVYARCNRLGLCYICKYEGADIYQRPDHKIFGICPTCDANMSIGFEKVQRQDALDRRKWFHD